MYKKLFLIILSFFFVIPIFVEAKSGYLYDVLKNEAKSNGLAREYTGEHHDSFTEEPSKKIYHWYGSDDNNGTAIKNKNNVIFANHCWQMIRTTDTGGVKLVYNGEAVNDQCLNTRGTHVGYVNYLRSSGGTYWFGTDYTYDSSTKMFSLAGEKERAVLSYSSYTNLIGKYTCRQSTETGKCSTLYIVESYYANPADPGYERPNVITIDSSSNYSQFGVIKYNSNSYLTHAGYMFESNYSGSTINMKYTESFTASESMLQSNSLNTTYWYADTIDYGNVAANKYSLVNPYQVSSTDDYPNLAGKYTFRNTNQTYNSAYMYYIAAIKGTTMYYKQLESGNLLSAYEPIMFSNSITDNGDGTYTLSSPVPVTLADWYTDYANYKNKYTCNNSSVTCENPRYITATTITNYTYIKAGEKIMLGKTRDDLTLTNTLLVRKDELIKNSSNYSEYKYTCGTDSANCTEANLRLITSYTETGYSYIANHYYGTSVTWDGTSYTLVDTIGLENYNNPNNISTHHYMCRTRTCTYAYYAYSYVESSEALYIISLSRGVTSVDEALRGMFTQNTKDSMIKMGVDLWYKHYLLENYDDYIEDTIFCNDRSISQYGGWNDNGGQLTEYLQFRGYNLNNDLSCPNVTDRFSVSNDQAKLTYKVGLLTAPEVNILNNNNARAAGPAYWLMTPSSYTSSNVVSNRYVTPGGLIYGSINATSMYGLRPAISLKTKTIYKRGNGSMETPYIIGDASKSNIIMNNDNSKGTISNLDNTTDIEEATYVTFTITPKKGYYVESLDIQDSNHEAIDYEVDGNNYTFQMPGSDTTITPIYEKVKSSINIQVVDETEDLNIEINDLTQVEYEEEVKFKITPIKGYKVTSIRIVDSNNHEINYSKTSNKNEYKFTMPDTDVTIIPSYERVKNSVVIDDNKNSKEIIIEVEDAKAVVYEDTVKFKVVPEEGYEVERIDILDKHNNKIEYKKTNKEYEYEFTMPDTDVIIQPMFKKITDPNYIINPKTGRNILIVLLIVSLPFIVKFYKKKKTLS